MARRYGCRLADPETIEEAPPRMRWRGPLDRAARTPLAHAQRPAARSATEADTRLRFRCPGSPCVRGAPRMVPVFGGERVLRPWPSRTQGFLVSNFTMFHASTKCPQLARSYPPQPRILHKKPTGQRAWPLRLPPVRVLRREAAARAPAGIAPAAVKHRAV